MPPKHFVITRIGLGIYDPDWYARMVPLFLAVTGPSLKHQTCQDFSWLIVIDAGIPQNARDQLEAFVEARENFHLVDIDVTRMNFMRLGGHDWIWEPCVQYILSRGLVSDPSEYIVTSTIDGDDAWSNDYVEIVNRSMMEKLPFLEQKESSRRSHLRHSSGSVLTFDQGLYWFINNDVIKPLKMAFHSMAIAVVARLSSGLSSISNRHLGWKHAASLVEFDIDRLSGPHPMWLYVRHDLSVQRWAIDPRRLSAPEHIMDELEKGFGVDLEKVRQWRTQFASDGTVHSGSKAADTYSRIFQLTGLNRQISALESREAVDSKAAELLTRQRSARDELLRQILAAEA